MNNGKLNFNDNKKKRKWKLKNEIIWNFKCDFPGCTKSYGSENSLN